MELDSKVFTYQAELVWRGGRVATVTSDERPELTVAPPPEFSGGHDDRWSPEHLYLASLESCTMLSFLAHCAHNDLDVEEYSSDATGSLERRGGDQRYAFTHVAMVVRARMAAGQAEAARGLTGKAERDCFISASTSATVETDWQITG
jgi:organic hydroperoxide reductase OsmC/OhrA